MPKYSTNAVTITVQVGCVSIDRFLGSTTVNWLQGASGAAVKEAGRAHVESHNQKLPC